MTNRTDTFGKALRSAREAAGVSQRQLAQRLGVSGTFVSDVEAAHRTPLTLELLKKAADFLGADLLPLLEARAQWSGSVEIPLTGDPGADGAALEMSASAVTRLDWPKEGV